VWPQLFAKTVPDLNRVSVITVKIKVLNIVYIWLLVYMLQEWKFLKGHYSTFSLIKCCSTAFSIKLGTQLYVTTHSNTVSWQCGHDPWPHNASKVGHAVKLRACSACCRYLAIASKGWYGHGLSRSGCATWHVTTVRCSAFFMFMMLLALVPNSESHGVTRAGNCYAVRLGMRVQIITPYRVGHLKRYGVTLQVCAHF
jgi:hypothetical protein